jgi:ABC-type dipeptide/oligopeptide/nickel transport system permease component
MKQPAFTLHSIIRFLRRHRYFFIKTFRAAGTALVILVLSFFMIRASGNPAEIYLGGEATPESIDYFNRKWGLDKPAAVQFFSYIGRVFHGDFGESLIKTRPVTEIIMDYLPATLSLMIPAAIIAITGGLLLGMAASHNHKKPLDSGLLIVSTLGFSLPNFFFGIVLIYLFSVVLGWLPPSGNTSLKHYIMPLITITTADIAVFTRFGRAAFIDIYEQNFITSFRSLGVKERRILFRHALPNASISLLTISGFYIGALITGAVVTENIFSWPGLGSLLVQSMKARDFPLVQALILLFGFVIVSVNLLVDILYGVIDPRIRKGGTA